MEKKITAACGSARNAWNANGGKLSLVLGKITGEKFVQFRKTFQLANYVKETTQKNIHWFTPLDENYPILLKKLAHSPFIIFYKREH